jgi:uncharacterized protein (TIGR02145 family)
VFKNIKYLIRLFFILRRMDKDNVFKSSKFHMDEGDILHILIKDATGDGTAIALMGLINEVGVTEDVNNTTPVKMKDLDGNEYDTVVIGNQEWTVDNLSTTKYADGSAIPNVVEDNDIADYAGWDNSGAGAFNTLTNTGLNISSCISNGLSVQAVQCANSLGVVDLTVRSYFEIVVSISNFILNSGVAPYLIIYDDDTDTVYYEGKLADGDLSIPITIPTNTLGIQIRNTTFLGVTPDACNCSADISISGIGWVENTAGAMCYYNNDIANKAIYGALYNWYALDNALGLVAFTREGVAVPGWRLPTVDDFNTLVAFLGSDPGGKLKETGTTHWTAPNTGATDTYGFKHVPGGARNTDGTFSLVGEWGSLWSDTEYDATNAYYRTVSYTGTTFSQTAYSKIVGFSVRCVREI